MDPGISRPPCYIVSGLSYALLGMPLASQSVSLQALKYMDGLQNVFLFSSLKFSFFLSLFNKYTHATLKLSEQRFQHFHFAESLKEIYR